MEKFGQRQVNVDKHSGRAVAGMSKEVVARPGLAVGRIWTPRAVAPEGSGGMV